MFVILFRRIKSLTWLHNAISFLGIEVNQRQRKLDKWRRGGKGIPARFLVTNDEEGESEEGKSLEEDGGFTVSGDNDKKRKHSRIFRPARKTACEGGQRESDEDDAVSVEERNKE